MIVAKSIDRISIVAAVAGSVTDARIPLPVTAHPNPVGPFADLPTNTISRFPAIVTGTNAIDHLHYPKQSTGPGL